MATCCARGGPDPERRTTDIPRTRLARADDLETLRGIERRAGEPFRQLGMDAVADDEPPSVKELAAFERAGRAWVVDGEVGDGDAGRPVAYLLLDVVDERGHIEQVSVDPAYARRGLGRALMETAQEWTVAHGMRALTLTTFADVAWNAPYYTRLGFHTLPPDRLTEGLRRIRAHEAERGLDRWPRVAMLKTIA